MIKIGYRNNARFATLGVCGFTIALIGLLIYIYTPLMLFVNYMVSMSPHSMFYKVWQKPPFEVRINVYIFNVTNHEAFLTKGEKMRVEEIGPYVYQESIVNTKSHFNDNGTLTYQPIRYLRFRPEKSIGDPKVDKVIVPNIPLLGIASYMKDFSFFVNLGLYQIVNMLDSQVFLNLTIEEYLFGYDDRLVTVANQALPNWINFKRFGVMDRLMALDNSSNVVTIKTTSDIISPTPFLTEDERSEQFSILTFNGSPGLHQWNYHDVAPNETDARNTKCNSVEGAIEGLFPRNITKDTSIRLYRRAFCRAVPMKYVRRDTFNGYDAIDYRVDPNFLETKEVNPENACYCYNGKCPQKGIGYLSPCYYGMPIVISQPHFYNADQRFLDDIDGLTPNEQLHDTFLKVNPTIGIPIAAQLRIQLNLDVMTKYSTKLSIFNGHMLPLFWLEMVVDELPWILNACLFLVQYFIPILEVILIWTLMLLGVAMIAATILFTFFTEPDTSSKMDRLEDPYENRIGYSPIRIIPMGQYLNPPSIRISK